MLVSFVETMRGRLRDARGGEHPFEFEVKAEADSVRDFISSGATRLTGVVRAAPWAAEASAQGTLQIVPFSRVAYRLEFADASGAPLVLEGAKKPSVLRPLSSMTRLPVELRDASGKVLAWGSAHFDLRDLPAFLATWVPGSRQASRALEARREQLVRRAPGAV